MNTDNNPILKQWDDAFHKYKERENTRTIQIFHVIALINAGILSSQLKPPNPVVYGFCYSLISLAFAYIYWYLVEIANLCVSQHSLLDKNEQTTEIIKLASNFSSKYHLRCFTSAIISAICLIGSILLLFDPDAQIFVSRYILFIPIIIGIVLFITELPNIRRLFNLWNNNKN